MKKNFIQVLTLKLLHPLRYKCEKEMETMSEMMGYNENKELDKETVDSYIDKLSTSYQEACESYNALCDRNDELLKVCRQLGEKNPEGMNLDIVANKLAHAEEIAKQIVEDVHREAIAIVEYAKDEVESIYDKLDSLMADNRYGLN